MFYSAAGKRSASVQPAQELIRRIRDALDVDIRLTIWESDRRAIEPVD